MSTVAAPEPVVTGGVDTHLDLHVAAALDHLGGVLGTASFPTTVAGYRRLLAWLRNFGPVGRVGVEGTGSYGAALARHLTAEGVDVVEVSRPNRQVRRRHGKTDVVDAIAAARAVMSGEATATPKTHDGAVESLRMLKLLQRSANKTRTQALNQLRSTLVTAPPEVRARLQPLSRPELLAVCAAFRIGADDDTIAGITRLTLRDLAQRVLFLDERLDQVDKRLRRITTAAAPVLVALHGVGPDTASTLLLAAGDNPERLTNERAFAALTGCSPIPASSGKVNRHRLNRGGDRQANSAPHRHRPSRHRPTHSRLRRQAPQPRQEQDRSHPLPQALHRARGLLRTPTPSCRLTVGASALRGTGKPFLVRLPAPVIV